MAPAWRRWRIYLQIPDYRAGSRGLDHGDDLSHDAGTVTEYGLGRFAENAQMAPAGTFDACRWFHLLVSMAGRRLGGSGSGLTDGIGQRQEVIRARLWGRRGHCQAQDFPAARDREAFRVLGAEIIGVRFGIRSERAQDRG